MSGRLETSVLQANDAMQGDYRTGQVISGGIGLGIYVGGTGDVEIITQRGTTVLYTAVPQGVQLQTPLFTAIGANTTSSDLLVAILRRPF